MNEKELKNISNKTAVEDLAQLVKLGQITSEGKGRAVRYYFTIAKKTT